MPLGCRIAYTVLYIVLLNDFSRSGNTVATPDTGTYSKKISCILNKKKRDHHIRLGGYFLYPPDLHKLIENPLFLVFFDLIRLQIKNSTVFSGPRPTPEGEDKTGELLRMDHELSGINLPRKKNYTYTFS
jgi:hypothetical protein